MERKFLAELNDLVERAQRVLAEHLPSDSGVSPTEAINRLDVLDGPDQRCIQGQVRELLAEQPAISF